MIEIPKDNPRSGISFDLNTPDNIPTMPLLDLGGAGIIHEDHFVSEKSMSPIPKGRRLKISIKIKAWKNENEIPRLIQETNERVYTVLKGDEETSLFDENKNDPDQRWRYFISMPIATKLFHDYGEGHGKKVKEPDGMKGIFIARMGPTTILSICGKSLKELYEKTRDIMQDILADLPKTDN